MEDEGTGGLVRTLYLHDDLPFVSPNSVVWFSSLYDLVGIGRFGLKCRYSWHLVWVNQRAGYASLTLQPGKTEKQEHGTPQWSAKNQLPYQSLHSPQLCCIDLILLAPPFLYNTGGTFAWLERPPKALLITPDVQLLFNSGSLRLLNTSRSCQNHTISRLLWYSACRATAQSQYERDKCLRGPLLPSLRLEWVKVGTLLMHAPVCACCLNWLGPCNSFTSIGLVSSSQAPFLHEGSLLTRVRGFVENWLGLKNQIHFSPADLTRKLQQSRSCRIGPYAHRESLSMSTKAAKYPS